MVHILENLRQMYDYVLVDIDKRLDETNLDVISSADIVFVVMTADLSCLKNVRLVLETMAQLGVENERVQLVLNRSTAYTGISAKHAEGALKRKISHQVVNEYRAAISALNSGAPFVVTKPDSTVGKSVLDFVKAIDKSSVEQAGTVRAAAASA